MSNTYLKSNTVVVVGAAAAQLAIYKLKKKTCCKEDEALVNPEDMFVDILHNFENIVNFKHNLWTAKRTSYVRLSACLPLRFFVPIQHCCLKVNKTKKLADRQMFII